MTCEYNRVRTWFIGSKDAVLEYPLSERVLRRGTQTWHSVPSLTCSCGCYLLPHELVEAYQYLLGGVLEVWSTEVNVMVFEEFLASGSMCSEGLQYCPSYHGPPRMEGFDS